MQPDDAEALARARGLLELGMTQNAISVLGRLLASTPGLAEALKLRGLAHRPLNEHALAEADIRFGPDDATRDGRRALEFARQACAKEPTPAHLDTLAAALAEVRQWDEAVKVMREALAKGPPREHLAAFRSRLAEFQQKKPFRT
jgi:tetratricopeptide (TPR) repeat protein